VISLDFAVSDNTMEGIYDDDDIVAESEVEQP
jgi:hypothetical protein